VTTEAALLSPPTRFVKRERTAAKLKEPLGSE
jgi:hypothetical protein